MEREREWGRYEEWERGIEGQNQHTKRKMHIMPELQNHSQSSSTINTSVWLGSTVTLRGVG